MERQFQYFINIDKNILRKKKKQLIIPSTSWILQNTSSVMSHEAQIFHSEKISIKQISSSVSLLDAPSCCLSCLSIIPLENNLRHSMQSIYLKGPALPFSSSCILQSKTFCSHIKHSVAKLQQLSLNHLLGQVLLMLGRYSYELLRK